MWKAKKKKYNNYIRVMVLDVGLKPWMVKITLLYQRDVTFSRKYPVTLENSVANNKRELRRVMLLLFFIISSY